MTSARLSIRDLREWIELRFDRSSGPGGQNVNKLNTRAALLFDFEGCPLLSADQRARVRARLAQRLSADGRLRVVSQRGRTQAANRLLAERRLLELLRGALVVPVPRRPTRPTRGARERRLAFKRRVAARKLDRRRGGRTDEEIA